MDTNYGDNIKKGTYMSEVNYRINGDFKSVEGSTWTPVENKLCLNFQKYYLRPAIERMKDKSPRPYLYVTLNKDIKLQDDTFKKGERMKAVLASRLGDIGLTRDLEAENGYEIRLDPYNKETMVDVSEQP